jgi:2-iminobutanoate/2-iminopropanoate deaminase
MQDMDEYATINDVYAGYFTGDPPARSAVEVGGLPLGALVEMEAVAVAR